MTEMVGSRLIFFLFLFRSLVTVAAATVVEKSSVGVAVVTGVVVKVLAVVVVCGVAGWGS